MAELNDIAKTSVRGGFYLFLGMTSATIILAITSIFISRVLGPENYGLFAISLIIPSFFSVITDMGISPTITRFSAQYRITERFGEIRTLIIIGLSLKLVVTLIVSSFLYLFSDGIARYVLDRPEIGGYVRLGILFLVGQAFLNSAYSVYNGIDEQSKNGVLMNIQAIVKAIVTLLLLYFGYGVTGAIMGHSAGFLLAAAVGIFNIIFRIFPKFTIEEAHAIGEGIFDVAKMMLSYGLPLYVASLLTRLYRPLLRIMLSNFQSNVVIGNYTVAMNFASLISVLTGPIAMTLFPTFSKFDIENSKDSLEKLFRTSVRYTSLILIPTSLAILVLSNYFVYIIYGDQYKLASGYLAFYLLNFLCAGIGTFVSPSLLNSQGNTVLSLKINIVNFILSVLMSYFLIPIYGAYGLMISMIISQIICSIMRLYFLNILYGFVLDFVYSIKITSASITSATILFLFINYFNMKISLLNLFIGGTVYIFSFLVISPIMGAISLNDIDNIEKFTVNIPVLNIVIKWVANVVRNLIKFNIFTTLIHE